jgi:hypothetical protein
MVERNGNGRACPWEDLLAHHGHGLAFVDEVERRARLAVFGARTVGVVPKKAQ